MDQLPAELRVVCAASRDDRALEQFKAENFLFRWLIDDNLDPADPNILRMGSVLVDNQQLTSGGVGNVETVGGRVRVLTYTVPRNLRETTGHLVEFQVLVRKFIGNERRFRIQAQLFRSVTDAEYRLTLDSGLQVTSIWPSASEVSTIGVARGGTAGSLFAAPFEHAGGIVRLPFPLQPGSTTAFQIDRLLAGAPMGGVPGEPQSAGDA